jgi:hypothetical protein
LFNTLIPDADFATKAQNQARGLAVAELVLLLKHIAILMIEKHLRVASRALHQNWLNFAQEFNLCHVTDELGTLEIRSTVY